MLFGSDAELVQVAVPYLQEGLVAAGRRRNQRYLPPARFLPRSRSAPPDPLEATDPVFVAEDLADLTQLRTLRDRLHRELVRALVSNPTSTEFVSAVGESPPTASCMAARRSRCASGRRWNGWWRP